MKAQRTSKAATAGAPKEDGKPGCRRGDWRYVACSPRGCRGWSLGAFIGLDMLGTHEGARFVHQHCSAPASRVM